MECDKNEEAPAPKKKELKTVSFTRIIQQDEETPKGPEENQEKKKDKILEKIVLNFTLNLYDDEITFEVKQSKENIKAPQFIYEKGLNLDNFNNNKFLSILTLDKIFDIIHQSFDQNLDQISFTENALKIVLMVNVLNVMTEEINIEIPMIKMSSQDEMNSLKESMKFLDKEKNELKNEIKSLNETLEELLKKIKEKDDKHEKTILELKNIMENNKLEFQKKLEEKDIEFKKTIDEKNTELQKKIDEKNTELQKTIDEKNTELQKKIEDNKTALETNKTELQKKIEDNKEALETNKEEIQKTIDEKNTELQKKIEDNKEALETNKTELQKKIDEKNTEVQKKLEDNNTEIQKKFEEKDKEILELRKTEQYVKTKLICEDEDNYEEKPKHKYKRELNLSEKFDLEITMILFEEKIKFIIQEIQDNLKNNPSIYDANLTYEDLSQKHVFFKNLGNLEAIFNFLADLFKDEKDNIKKENNKIIINMKFPLGNKVTEVEFELSEKIISLERTLQYFSSTFKEINKNNIITNTNLKDTKVDLGNTKYNLEKVKSDFKRDLLEKVYPIGSYYWSSNNKSPSEIFGGSWTKINGRFLFASDSNHQVGDTGGEESVTLKINEIPSHSHDYDRFHYDFMLQNRDGKIASQEWCPLVKTSFYESDSTTSTGGGCSHNNMPPFLTANCWKRTG